MRARIAATVFLAAGILLGTTGCNLVAPQATQLEYDPSDGVGGDVGEIAVRNALLITNDGTSANLLVTLVNEGDESHRVSVQWEASEGRVTEEITVPARGNITVGADGGPSVTLREVEADPGSLFPVFFQYGDETGTDLQVPVLEGNLEVYSTLTPTPAPPTSTPLPAQAPAETATPEPTETPAP